MKTASAINAPLTGEIKFFPELCDYEIQKARILAGLQTEFVDPVKINDNGDLYGGLLDEKEFRPAWMFERDKIERKRMKEHSLPLMQTFSIQAFPWRYNTHGMLRLIIHIGRGNCSQEAI